MSETVSGASRRIAGPFNRVEGDLEIQIDMDSDRVTKAWVVSPLYRGFEQILQGKDPMDALVYVPRICGICSVAQSVAAASAIADLAGVTPTNNGQLATNLIRAAPLSCEKTKQVTRSTPFDREICIGLIRFNISGSSKVGNLRVNLESDLRN